MEEEEEAGIEEEKDEVAGSEEEREEFSMAFD